MPPFARLGPSGGGSPTSSLLLRHSDSSRPDVARFSLRFVVPGLPEAARSPRFLDDPCARAPVSDPGGGSAPGPRAPSPCVSARSFRLLRRSSHRPPRACGFRGSMSPPMHSLSTLRSCPREQTTQDSLPAGGPRPCRLGLAPTGHIERFQSLHVILLSQACPGARTKPLTR
jgi:hypothetical protein